MAGGSRYLPRLRKTRMAALDFNRKDVGKPLKAILKKKLYQSLSRLTASAFIPPAD
jgi:hypothetical protein